MKVILLKDVRNVGKKYEVKNVSDGFAMNSLIPRKLAELATPAAEKRLAEFRRRDADTKKVRSELLEKNISSVENVRIELSGKGNDKGHLFAAIHVDDLVAALKEQARLDIDADLIDLEKPIKEAGEHKIPVKVGGAKAEFTLVVTLN